MRSTELNDSEKAVDSFCSADKGRRPDGGRTRQRGSVARRRARTIEKQIARIGTAAATPVSVSRHLVSKSVQFGQSATGKTESDQWLLVAHLFDNLSYCAIYDVG